MSRVGDHARELHADALTWPQPADAADMTWTVLGDVGKEHVPWTLIAESYGRSVSVRIDPPEADPGVGQFHVALLVDGKERYAAYFTDKSEDA